MAMWVSVPCSEEEKEWLQWLGGGLRLSSDFLWRKSGVEAAFVTKETWRHWGLPEPAAPIVSFAVPDLTVPERIVAAGARWASEVSRRPWGVEAGFLRFPSGLLVEIALLPQRAADVEGPS